MDVRHRQTLPIACEGILFRRPLVLAGLLSTNLVLWAGLVMLFSKLV